MDTKYKIMFLVPVFEAPDCVEDLIQNFHTIAPNSGILFHINSECDEEFVTHINKLVDFYDFCHILPTRYPTSWSSGFLFNTFVDMMNWCVQKNISDYVYITHSNSLLINKDLEKKIYQYDIFFPSPGIKTTGDWWEFICEDYNILNYIKTKDNTIYSIAIEGVAMKLQPAKDCVEDLLNWFIKTPVKYPSEEYYIPTSLQFIKDKYNYKDTSLERWGHTLDQNVCEYQLQVQKNTDYIIPMILNNQNLMLSGLNLYSVKKIKREYHYKIRTIIREHFGYQNLIYK